MVDVRVQFDILCASKTRKAWAHEFSVPRGSTVRKLKQLMLLPNGGKTDADEFELQRRGRRVPDFEKIWQDATYDFFFLGPEQGRRKAEHDDAREAGTAEEELALGGNWLVVNDKDSSQKAWYVFRHEPGSNIFVGEQVGYGSFGDGRINGKEVEWTIGDFTCRGRVQDRGRTITELRVVTKNNAMVLGTYEGMRLFDAACWERYPHYDLKGRGDVETMEAKDLDKVKRRVEKMGYAGFSVWQGFAYLKAPGKQLTREDLDYGGDENPVEFYLFVTPDPYAEWEEAEETRRRQELQAAGRPEPPAPEPPAAEPPAAESPAAATGPRAQQTTQPQAERRPSPAQLAEVAVTVRHALPEMESQITVRVSGDCTVMAVRRAVMALLGETKLSQVKIVKKTGQGYASLDCEREIGDRREFLSLGRSLTLKDGPLPAPAAATAARVPPAASPAAEPVELAEAAEGAASRGPLPAEEVELGITSTDDGRERSLTLPGDATVRQLKTTLCEQGAAAPPPTAPTAAPAPALGAADAPAYAAAVAEKGASGSSLLQSPSPAAAPAPEGAAVAAKGRASGPSSLEPSRPEAAPEEEGELEVVVSIDRALGLEMPLTAKWGSSVGALKALLAATDPTGQARPEHWSLGLSPPPEEPDGPVVPLSDNAPLTEALVRLDLIQKPSVATP